MNMPPIKDSARMSHEEAISALLKEGFLNLEAQLYLNEKEPHRRQIIVNEVQARKKGMGPALV